MTAPGGVIWESLVSESQFATDLTISGLRRLATVPIGRWGSGDDIDFDRSYPLHVGLHSFTSGLERLSKIAIACHGLVSDGEFASVRSYSHNLDALIRKAASLDFSDRSLFKTQPGQQPAESTDSTIVDFLVRFASGAGRYEHIDALARTDPTIDVAAKWAELVASSSVSESIVQMIYVRSAVVDHLRGIADDNGLMASASRMLFDLDEVPLDQRSIGVVVRLYRVARWVASLVCATTDFTDERLPILQDVVYRLSHGSDDFVQYEIVRIEDMYLAIEELTELQEHGSDQLVDTEDF
nr:hypothetical protein [uncultured Microbacterium sp.]